MSEDRRPQLEDFLSWRGIDTFSGESPCRECGGTGYKAYGSTATWRGGIGGQAITRDVCDRCWGSGIEGKPWPSHRELRRLHRAIRKLADDVDDPDHPYGCASGDEIRSILPNDSY